MPFCSRWLPQYAMIRLLALASTVFHCWEQGIELSMAELSVSASI